jgi:uncharacterized membrane protein
MKLLLIPFVWLMVPIAFIVLAYDIARAYVEEKAEEKLKEKNA